MQLASCHTIQQTRRSYSSSHSSNNQRSNNSRDHFKMLTCDNCLNEIKIQTKVSCGHTLCPKCLDVVTENCTAVCPIDRCLVSILIDERTNHISEEQNKGNYSVNCMNLSTYNHGRNLSIPLPPTRVRSFDTTATCKFASLGCPFQGSIYELENHEKNTRFHIDLLLKSNLDQKREMEEIKEKALIMRNALQFCEKYISAMELNVKCVEEKTKEFCPQIRNILRELQSMKDVIAIAERCDKKINKHANVNLMDDLGDFSRDQLEKIFKRVNSMEDSIAQRLQSLAKYDDEINRLKLSKDSENKKFKDMFFEIDKLSERIFILEESINEGNGHPKMGIKQDDEINKLKTAKAEINRILENQLKELIQLKDIANGRSFSYVWKIESFSRIWEEAKIGINSTFTSKPFFTNKYGYKMELFISPNGDEQAKGTHLSCYLQIIKGPYDDILKWPIEYKARLCVLDQSHNENHICTELSLKSSEETGDVNCKPIKENLGWGEAMFFPLNKLKPPYLVNDKLFIKLDCTLTN